MDVGVRIEHYEVVEHIGRGGMADVWSARDTSLGRMVAIKTIAPDLSMDGDPLSLFEQEARTIANLEHPHILPIYGFGKFQGKLYIVMRYVTGGSLEDVLTENTISFDYALQVGRSLGDALQHAHSENIIHLDLKPPNVLMDSKGVPYLADFGLATALGADGRAKNPGAGTLLYMAPEQLTADRLDHRADIYSFSLVMYHMLTGGLPFMGRTPLAVRQLQQQDQLPSLNSVNVELPDALTEILRQGTALYPEDRYDSVLEMVQHIEEVMGISGKTLEGSVTGTGSYAGMSDFLTSFDPETIQKREAEDIYRRAQQAWDKGNGRFLLSVTHYMVMSDFYIDAETHELAVDREGLQVLLRGALEYNYDLDYWWESQPDTDSRRWVCLHAIRSENPAARVRAYKKLVNLPDSDPPKIVNQVAQALALENNEEAALAALTVLGERDRKPNYRAKALARKSTFVDTVFRDQLQIVSSAEWQQAAFGAEVDRVIAGMALDGMTAHVREKAARTVGKLRSVAAVEHLLEELRTNPANRRTTIRAFGFILDETPSLPPEVPVLLRLVAWLQNTKRLLTQEPMQLVRAFAAAVAGGWLGMGQQVYRTFFSEAVFDQQRMLNTFAFGLLFGLLLGVTVVMAKVLPERLRGFWPNWTRLVWSAVSGYYLSQFVWWSYTWWLLNLDSPPTDILVLTGIGTAIGLVIPAMVKMRGWAAVLLMTVTTYIVQYIGTLNFWRVYNTGEGPLSITFPWWQVQGEAPYLAFKMLRFGDDSWIFAYYEWGHVYTILLPLVIFVALGTHLPALLADLRGVLAVLRPQETEEELPRRRTGSMTPVAKRERPATRREVVHDAQEVPKVPAPTTDFYNYGDNEPQGEGNGAGQLMTLRVDDLPPGDERVWDDNTEDRPGLIIDWSGGGKGLEELGTPTDLLAQDEPEADTNWDAMLDALETDEDETVSDSIEVMGDKDDTNPVPLAAQAPVQRPTPDEVQGAWDTMLNRVGDEESEPPIVETGRIEDVAGWDSLSTEKLTDEQLQAAQHEDDGEDVESWDSITRQLDGTETDEVEEAADEWDAITRQLDELEPSGEKDEADSWDAITRQLDELEPGDEKEEVADSWDAITRKLDELDSDGDSKDDGVDDWGSITRRLDED